MPTIYEDPRFRTRLQEQGLALLARNRGFEFSQTFFPYTSGKISPYYVHAESVMRDGHDNARAIELLATLYFWTEGRSKEHNASPTRVITGGESCDWMFSQPVATRVIMPHTMLYKDGRTAGASLMNAHVTHIADLNNEGSSMRDYWLPTIRRESGTLTQALFFVDRCEEGMHVMKELGITNAAVVPLDAHAWDYLYQQAKAINEEEYHSLQSYRENREAWARSMLRSKAGIERLFALLCSSIEKEQDATRKVLNKGYPELREELLERLKKEIHTELAL